MWYYVVKFVVCWCWIISGTNTLSVNTLTYPDGIRGLLACRNHCLTKNIILTDSLSNKALFVHYFLRNNINRTILLLQHYYFCVCIVFFLSRTTTSHINVRFYHIIFTVWGISKVTPRSDIAQHRHGASWRWLGCTWWVFGEERSLQR